MSLVHVLAIITTKPDQREAVLEVALPTKPQSTQKTPVRYKPSLAQILLWLSKNGQAWRLWVRMRIRTT